MLKQLWLTRVRITEEAIAELERALPELEVGPPPSLDLRETNFSAARVGVLKLYNENLKELWLGGTDVSDASMEDISHLFLLEFLDLEDTDVTDASIPLLKRLRNLRELSVRGTLVSEDGVKELERAISGLKVTR